MMTFPPICDYEGSDYRQRFWEGQGREYEDLSERVALRRLMPGSGSVLIEIGAGFGRLASEYRGYEKVVLFDYSRSLLREAQARLGNDPRLIYVAGNWYDMPFVDGLFDTLVQIRSLHHTAEPAALFDQLARIGRPGGNYVLEFANKKNLKAILRYALRRQSWSPFEADPVEFTHLHYDFHPAWVRERLRNAGFTTGQALSVSYFRVPFLKRFVPTPWLVGIDSLMQHTGQLWQLSPSVFMHNHVPSNGRPAPAGHFFACPKCTTPLEDEGHSSLSCGGCGLKWAVEDGLYDFKTPIAV
jgi:ubiquinone/menaquinone biosynthesis C-methylase UbiE